MPLWLLSALKGLLFGLAVSGLNHFILFQGIKNARNLSPAEKKNVILKRYSLRYLINIGALLSAYFILKGDVPFLVATALGLTVSKNVYIIKYFRTRKA